MMPTVDWVELLQLDANVLTLRTSEWMMSTICEQSLFTSLIRLSCSFMLVPTLSFSGIEVKSTLQFLNCGDAQGAAPVR
jgi:hypothetical protein